MPDLKACLDRVAAVLTGDGFLEPESCRETIRRRAIEHAGDLFPLRLFAAWIDRCPEARDVLVSCGLSWGTVSVPSVPLPAAPPPPQSLSVGVGFAPVPQTGKRLCRVAAAGGNYVEVELVSVHGAMVVVKHVLGKNASRNFSVPVTAFHPDDQQEVKKFIADHPGPPLEWESSGEDVVP